MSRDKDRKGKNLLIWKGHVTMTKKEAFMSNDMKLQTHSLTFIHKNKSILSATSVLSRSPMAYNTTVSLDKLTCTDYVDFGKCQDGFGPFSWSKNDSNFLYVKLKVLKKGDNIEFRLVQSLLLGEADFNKFLRQRNQLVNAAKNLSRDENLTPVLIPTMSKDMDEQLKLAHKVFDVVHRAS